MTAFPLFNVYCDVYSSTIIYIIFVVSQAITVHNYSLEMTNQFRTADVNKLLRYQTVKSQSMLFQLINIVNVKKVQHNHLVYFLETK